MSAEPSDHAILTALNEPTSIDFTDVPLADCLDYLVDFHNIPIVIDEDGLKEVKVTRETPFTYKSKKEGNTSTFPLCRALWAMLGRSDVSFMIVDHKLVITSARKAKEWQADFAKNVKLQR